MISLKKHLAVAKQILSAFSFLILIQMPSAEANMACLQLFKNSTVPVQGQKLTQQTYLTDAAYNKFYKYTGVVDEATSQIEVLDMQTNKTLKIDPNTVKPYTRIKQLAAHDILIGGVATPEGTQLAPKNRTDLYTYTGRGDPVLDLIEVHSKNLGTVILVPVGSIEKYLPEAVLLVKELRQKGASATDPFVVSLRKNIRASLDKLGQGDSYGYSWDWIYKIDPDFPEEAAYLIVRHGRPGKQYGRDLELNRMLTGGGRATLYLKEENPALRPRTSLGVSTGSGYGRAGAGTLRLIAYARSIGIEIKQDPRFPDEYTGFNIDDPKLILQFVRHEYGTAEER